MSLPKNIRPEYSTTIPSTGKKIKYQPFTVKEEKILILAAESQDVDEITNAISNCLNNCVTAPADFDVKDLALFDIEYLFLKARAKSAGEKINVLVTDPGDETFTTEHDINIDKIQIQRTKGHSELIKLTEEVTVKMRYPDITFFNEGVAMTDISTTTSLVSRCVAQIVVGEEVYSRADMSETEVEDWVESLTTEQFTKVTEFFRTMPKLAHTFTIKNTNTGEPFSITLEGLADFF